jgi:uncharacterized protein with PIN domain
MFLDASALTAILAPETDGEAFAELHADADQCRVSALIIWGTSLPRPHPAIADRGGGDEVNLSRRVRPARVVDAGCPE